MEYNTTRDKLIISEYGRNIQKLVKHCISIEDREERTAFAKMIVRIMGQINPATRDSSDYRHKLWDHLFVISDFKLDVDSPYPPPSPRLLNKKPEKISYGANSIRFRHYGSNIVKMIDAVKDYEEGPEKEALILTLANHLKKSYLQWNRESVDDAVILDHLRILSGGELELKEGAELSAPGTLIGKKKKKKKKMPPPQKNYRQRNPRHGY